MVSEAHAKFGVGTHELRTPLHGLLGQLDLVRDTLSSGELSVLPGLLDSADFCGAALRDIVDDILDFGKTAQGANSAGRPRHVLVDLVQVTVETTRSCWLRQVQWQSVAAESTPPPPVGLVVEYEDRSMLKNWWISLDLSGFMRILNSLVTNSLKYTAEGLITVSLASGSALEENEEGDEDRHIILRVEDTGRGIAPEFLSKLFDPFTQADSFSPGAGLGLHLCKSVVERMHGNITVESRLGGGSIFTVMLPVEDIELHPAGATQIMRQMLISAEPTQKFDPPLSKSNLVSPQITVSPPPRILAPLKMTQRPEDKTQHLKILVVDDNAISRKVLIRMLKNSNVTTYEAEDGVCALEVFREMHPHVVWTDVSMPRSVRESRDYNEA
ncbi:histidine kinase-like ATPase [Mycena galopus ATCC 62051]|nr:histidine kinase-like ATPase [Mycena galopus ATCC 62051]